MNLKNNKLKLLMGVIILITVSTLIFFGQEVIEEKDIRIKTLESRLYEREKENKELSLLLEEKSEVKDIEITKYYENGQKKESKVIKTKKDSKNQALSKKESSEKERESTSKETQMVDKTKTHKNPKRWSIGAGVVSQLRTDSLDISDLKPELELEARAKVNNYVELQGRLRPESREADISLKLILEF